MKLVKYDKFNIEKINVEDKIDENLGTLKNFWQDAKYNLSKILGRYKVGGKIFGKRKVDEESKEEIKSIMKKESNKLLKQVYDEVLNKAPEFPNDRKKVTFLKGVIIYSQFYESILASVQKNPEDEGYLSPIAANQIIIDLRKVVKKHLEVDLKSIYKAFESKKEEFFESEMYQFEEELRLNEEKIVSKISDWLFGKKKSSSKSKIKALKQSRGKILDQLLKSLDYVKLDSKGKITTTTKSSDVDNKESQNIAKEVTTQEESKDIQFKFFNETKKLFQAIIGLEEQISNKRVIIEGDPILQDKVYMIGDHTLTPGLTYKYKNSKVPSSTPIDVILLSLEYVINLGKSGNYFNPDATKSEQLKQDVVLVAPVSGGKPMKVNYKELKATDEPKVDFWPPLVVGKEYLHTGNDGKETLCQLLSTTHVMKRENDKWVEVKELPKGKVHVAYWNPLLGKFSSVGATDREKLSKVKQTGSINKSSTQPDGTVSFYKNIFSFDGFNRKFNNHYKNYYEAYTPVSGATKPGTGGISGSLPTDHPSYDKYQTLASGRTNTNIINLEEKDAVAAWKKIMKVYNNKTINLTDLSKELKKQIRISTEVADQDKKKFRFEALDKSNIILIGKQVIQNETTIGKPISFQELIKEQTTVLDIANRISLLSTIILGFSDDLGLTGSYGLAGDQIKNFVRSYQNLKELYTKLIAFEKSQKVTESKRYKYLRTFRRF